VQARSAAQSAALAEAGADVTLVTRSRDHVDAMNRDGPSPKLVQEVMPLPAPARRRRHDGAEG
jgi:cation diffusion facilitator CzcD-associated flavoprotein CzcO